MGWTVLYIAFGIVALWLLGEVLLQYKARLRWRLLAFVGFLGVVFGVLIPSVPVIAVGAVAFAIGQTYVTLSFRKGFESGWAVSRPALAEGFTKRRKGKKSEDRLDDEAGPAAPPPAAPFAGDADPALDAAATAAFERATGGYDDDFDRDDVFTPARPLHQSPDTVYEPQPMPDETGTYGVYSDSAYAAATGQEQYASYDGYTGYDQQQYGYDTTGEQQQYAAYSDPYIGTQTYGTGSYDTTGYDQQQYGTQPGYPQDQYAQQGYSETPAGGVWVPQQRNTDDPSYNADLPADQQYYQDGQGQQQHGNGYDEQQYRF
ncbi:hypothetical protein [Streptomyces sp. 4F14]|uniref:SCO2102 family sporulation regulator n=1 Tax=Streptomyces sp. 4F14 TaxID=3394380 RepID=UPI003A892FD6